MSFAAAMISALRNESSLTFLLLVLIELKIKNNNKFYLNGSGCLPLSAASELVSVPRSVDLGL